MQRSLTATFAILAPLCAVHLLWAEDNPLMSNLLTSGVVFAKNDRIVLPAATLRDGLSAAEQQQQIAAIPENQQSWENLTRRSVVAPFVLKLSQTEDGAKSIGRSLDLWFVAYGSLARLASDKFTQEQFQDVKDSGEVENRPRVQLLSDDALTRRGLTVPRDPADPRYLAVEISLLDRARISATTMSVKTTTRDSVTLASVLDRQFDRDPDFANAWRSIERDDSGRRTFGSPQTYNGMGSYLKATRLVEPAGAILIEYHLAFAEPEGWFHGANLLRSKLPIVAQDGVRRFRRNLEKQP